MPMLEMMFTGKVEDLGKWALVQNLISIPPIFWWYHVIALTIVALPIYFIRSRGWKRGSVSILKGLVVFAGVVLLGMAGEWLGTMR
jgi:hypothetical protein